MSMSPHSETSTPEEAAATAVTSRRSFVRTAALGAAALGTVAATGAALTGVAGASEMMTSSSGGAGAAAAESSLSAVDAALLTFLQSISLAAQQALQSASDATYLSNVTMERMREFSRHHRDQAARLGKLLPTDAAAATPANASLLAQMTSKFNAAGTETEMLNALAGFEESFSATFIVALGQADHFTVSEAIAGCAPILGQQAASAGADAGQPQSTWLPAFAPTSGAITQSAYPIR